jgi:outer membrane receptor for monomeric catechols
VTSRLESAVSASFQEVRYVCGDDPPNSPEKLLHARSSVPLLGDRVVLSAAGRYISRRYTPYGSSVGGALVADVVVATKHLHRDFDLQFGVRNLFDRRYFDPMSEEHTLRVMQRAGRSLILKLNWHSLD